MRKSGVVEYVKWNLSRSHPDRDICDDLAEHRLGEPIPGLRSDAPDEPRTSDERFPKIGEGGEDAAKKYSMSSAGVNSALREAKGGVPDFNDSEKDIYSGLMDGLSGKVLEQDETLFRGVSGLYLLEEAYKIGGSDISDLVGTTLVDWGFGSTSLSMETPAEFGDAIYRIKAPKGTNLADISSSSALGYQKEILLPPGSKYMVVGYERGEIDGVRKRFLDVILLQEGEK
jgi:hypothetical protein